MFCAVDSALYTLLIEAGRSETKAEDSLKDSSTEDLETGGLVAVIGVNIDK